VKPATDTDTGRIIASYGTRGILLDSSGERHRYILKGRKLKAVCGDRVEWRPQASSADAQVVAICERDNCLQRPDSRGRPELLAANLTTLVVVAAPEPAPELFMIDRYLCAAELLNIEALLVWNKSDLSPAPPVGMEEYTRLGYALKCVSAFDANGITDLARTLSQGINMLAGQSGVGKSSLINQLLPGSDVRVGELSNSSREGRHTTTASYMHRLPAGGWLIDSPGVREFAPYISGTRDIQRGFRELFKLSRECRFSDCQHLREPDCAIKNACTAGEISERRYESYKRLLHTVTALTSQR